MANLLSPNPHSTPFVPRQTLKTLKSIVLKTLQIPSTLFPMASPNPSPEPQFDTSRPSIPISYPIKTLVDLESRSYFDSFHYPFNVSSVPLPQWSIELLPRRRLLVCHDMMGGYADDRWVQGGDDDGAYAIWHWHLMDVFVYFSHNLVSLPPPGWTNAAHTHGVKVLGTFIAESKEGEEICKTLLSTKEAAQMYAERLAELAAALGFDGWLINMEVNLEGEQIVNLKEFVSHLTQTMHSSVRGSLIIWYDSVTKDGKLDYQNELNGKNKPFFDLCDGLFANYTWKESYPKQSAVLAEDRRFDVYMGIDVFGRGTFGGGQWHTSVALDLLKKDDISAAIFAPGWVYENLPKEDFQANQNKWWGLVEKSWGLLQSYPKALPFYSNFDQGHGIHFSIKGLRVADGPWNNISRQGFQPALDNTVDPKQSAMQVFINFEDASYSGGGHITCKGSLKDDEFFLTRLFLGQLTLEDLPLHFTYSVKSDDNSLLGLCLELSSDSNDQVAILLADGDVPEDKLLSKYHKATCVPVRKPRGEVAEGGDWVVYEASIAAGGYTLTNINIFCCQRPRNERHEMITGELPAYRASLGHISIKNTTLNVEFLPADSWVIGGQHISWARKGSGTRTVSLNIIWKLKSELVQSFVKYIIFIENLADRANKGVKQFLGVARVQTYYVSDVEVPVDVTRVKFIVQACRSDGTCQQIDESPTFVLDAGEKE